VDIIKKNQKKTKKKKIQTKRNSLKFNKRNSDFVNQKLQRKIIIATALVTTKAIISLTPLTIAISILVTSAATALILFKYRLSRWLSFVLVLTFASGMIILFVYATSLSPNEKTRSRKKNKIIVLPLIIAVCCIRERRIKAKESIKTFSNQSALIIIALLLVLTMLALSLHTYNPLQTTSSRFYEKTKN
jgi:hypothetical protein